MAKSYAEGIESISAEARGEAAPNNSLLHWCKDEAGRTFFRLDFDLPAIFMLSEPVSRFRAYRQYVVPISEESSYYASMALIPAYIGNFNRITCIDLYGDQAAAFFSAGSRPLQHDQKTFWRFEPSDGSPAQISSLNFVLKWNSVERELPDTLCSALELYFKLAFWVQPLRGFSCNAHLIHSRDNISRIMKVSKGLYIVREVGEVHPERIAPYYTALVQKVRLDSMTDSGVVWHSAAYMAKDVVERLTSDGPATNKVVNGTIFEFKDKVPRHGGSLSMLSVVDDFLPTDYDMFSTLAGLTASEAFRADPQTLGEIGTCDGLYTNIARRFSFYAREAPIEGTLFSKIERPVEFLVDKLFPVLVRDKEKLFFVHPLIMSGLLRLRLARVIENQEKDLLIAFLRLLQMMRTEKPLRLRFTREAESFKGAGVDFSDLLPVLHSCFCGIEISRWLDRFL